jgi:hypothetical protein
MMSTRLMNALQQVFEYMDVAPGDVYWRYDGVEFSLGRDWEVMVDDYHDPAGDVDDGFYIVIVKKTNRLGQAIDREFEVTDKRGNTFVVRGSLLCSIEACQRRINDRLAESENAL